MFIKATHKDGSRIEFIKRDTDILVIEHPKGNNLFAKTGTLDWTDDMVYLADLLRRTKKYKIVEESQV